MSAAIETLDQFITRAERDRKYAPNTAAGLRAALKVFADSMNEQEKESLEVLEQRLDQIYNEVYRKKSGKMSTGSLQTYYRRVKRLIHDHNTYGADPNKMTAWSPQRRSHAPKPPQTKKGKKRPPENNAQLLNDKPIEEASAVGNNDRFEISFSIGQRAIVILPVERTKADINKLKKLVDFIEATSDLGESSDEQK